MTIRELTLRQLPSGLVALKVHTEIATGPRAVPGSQQPRLGEGTQTHSRLPVQADPLRAGDGARSDPWPSLGGMPMVLGCALALLSGGSLRAATRVDFWLTTEDLRQRLSLQPGLAFDATAPGAKNRLEIEDGKTFQTILGLGSSLEPTT